MAVEVRSMCAIGLRGQLGPERQASLGRQQRLGVPSRRRAIFRRDARSCPDRGSTNGRFDPGGRLPPPHHLRNPLAYGPEIRARSISRSRRLYRRRPSGAGRPMRPSSTIGTSRGCLTMARPTPGSILLGLWPAGRDDWTSRAHHDCSGLTRNPPFNSRMQFDLRHRKEAHSLCTNLCISGIIAPSLQPYPACFSLSRLTNATTVLTVEAGSEVQNDDE